jgi:PiT family inorganic phosphate transporter
MLLIFLSSGIFLGWSLGANDAANVFGSAVTTRMLRYRTAALICGLFVIIGSVISGAGASETLGVLGSVNALAGAFMVALAAAVTVFWMTRLGLPVSTSQAIVGAIIGWNLFTGSPTDWISLKKIVLSWIASPVLAAVVAIALYGLYRLTVRHVRVHLLRIDLILRIGLILVGAFGSYSLGANNIANVMGVFVPVTPFTDFDFMGWFTLTGVEQLFLIGGIAIAVGAYTFSRKVMETVGGSLLKLSPEAALIVVLSQAIVLFVFASESLETWLISHGLPAFPLVPVSSSQAIIGGVIGIGLIKGARAIKFRVFGQIASGWITTPILACIITFFSLFFLQNVFNQQVSKRTVYMIDENFIRYSKTISCYDPAMEDLVDKPFTNITRYRDEIGKVTTLTDDQITTVIQKSRYETYYINPDLLNTRIRPEMLSGEQLNAVRKLQRKTYHYRWEFLNELEKQTGEWGLKTDESVNRQYNKLLEGRRNMILDLFRLENQ